MNARLLVLAALVALSVLAAVQRTVHRTSTEGVEAPGTLRIETSLTPVLAIYVNGKLVHRGVDPATRNFQLLLAYLLAGTYHPSVVDTDGSMFTVSFDGYNAPIWQSATIAFGTGSQPFSRTVYRLANEIYSNYASYSEGSNSTHAWIVLSAAYSSASAVTITEVGLKVQVYDGAKYRWVLLLYTPVNVALNPGDNLTAVYTFCLQGLSKNTLEFWKLFSLTPPLGGTAYWTVLTDENGTSRTFETSAGAYCYVWRYAGISSAVILELGTGTAAPSTSDYRLQSKVLEGRTGAGLVVDDGRVIFTTTVIPSSSYSITEVGVALWVNDYNGNLCRVLIARYLLPAPVQLTANKPVTIAWVLKLP